MKTLTVPAQPEQIEVVQEFISQELEKAGCDMKIQMQIEVAVEEIFVNIAHYAYDTHVGEATIRCEILENPLRTVIQFMDHGVPFDPLQKEDADTSPEALCEREGGLGILMVKKMMDGVSYFYEDGKNILTINKNL